MILAVFFGNVNGCASKKELKPQAQALVGVETIQYFLIKLAKSCHHQNYQNCEQPPQRLQNLYFQSRFSASKIKGISLIFFCEEY